MESVSEHFSTDHDRLDSLFAEFRALKRKDPPAAKQKFKEFLKGLTRHIVWEEDVLFPAFEKSGPAAAPGPVSVMRREHREIKGLLDALHDKVRRADPESDAEEKELLALLGAHNMKEERVLYPAIDEALGQEGLALARAAMEAIPEERYACCCHAR